MIYGPPTASSPNERDVRTLQGREVDFFPWILIPTDDNARVVAIEQQQGLLM